MSDENTAEAETVTSDETVEQGKQFDADYVAKLRDEAAKYRTQAKVNAEAATKLAEIEEAQKSEQQKAEERLAAAEKRAADLEVKASRAEIANELGVPVALLAGPADSSPDSLRSWAESLIAFKGADSKSSVYVPAEGHSPGANALNGDGLEQALRAKLNF